jgi:hypothetical protein
MDHSRYERGMAARREVLGDSYVEQAVARTTDFTRAEQRVIAGRGQRSPAANRRLLRCAGCQCRFSHRSDCFRRG